MRKVKSRQYGSTVIQRGKCTGCDESCFICKDKTSSCCGEKTIPYTSGVNAKETHGIVPRKHISVEVKKRILQDQDNKCFWCGREFGEHVLSPKKLLHLLVPNYDHYIPYSYCGDDKLDNFVASCQRCNLHKSATIIANIDQEDDLRSLLKRLWYRGGWEDLTGD